MDAVAAAAAPRLIARVAALLPERAAPAKVASSPGGSARGRIRSACRGVAGGVSASDVRKASPSSLSRTRSDAEADAAHISALSSPSSSDEGGLSDTRGSTATSARRARRRSGRSAAVARFDPSRDSRHLYRGAGLELYHKQEKTRDAFLAHLRTQLDVEASLNPAGGHRDGAHRARTESFAACRRCLAEVGAASRWWFATFFVETMVRVCVEQPFEPIRLRGEAHEEGAAVATFVARAGAGRGGHRGAGGAGTGGGGATGGAAAVLRLPRRTKNLLDRRLTAPSALQRDRSSELIQKSPARPKQRKRLNGGGGRGGRGGRSGQRGRGSGGSSNGGGGGGAARRAAGGGSRPSTTAAHAMAAESPASAETIATLFSSRESLFVDFLQATDSASLGAFFISFVCYNILLFALFFCYEYSFYLFF